MTSAKAPARAWQRMLSGRRLDLLNPSPLDVELDDIAHGLARVARWNGQTRGEHIFSVAQHSLLVEAIAAHLHVDLRPADRLSVLLHDAPEYVIGDMISPFKAVIGDAYKEIEAGLLSAIRLRFGLSAVPAAPLVKVTKRADQIAAFHEAIGLAGFSRQEAAKFFGRPELLPAQAEAILQPWPVDDAQRRFAARVEALCEG